MTNAKYSLKPKSIFPKSVFFVLGNELCERFSYYGMRSVLILFLTQRLQIERHDAKTIYHSSVLLNYFMPIFGAILADVYFGKYKTILYVSIVYSIGNIFLSLVSVPQLPLMHIGFAALALVIIAIGTGGIKPCVSAFGGDQFHEGQESMREKFFSIFYFCINVGSLMSMFLSPIFRARVSCLGERECYPLAFGFPALLMVIATVIFACGRPFYNILPPQGTAVVDVVRCIWHALKRKRQLGMSKDDKKHWLDYADDRFDSTYIADVKTILSILLLFLPLPMFWALFDQQGSSWTLQSARMRGVLSKDVEIYPDQMDSLNAFLVIIFIPFFTFVLYPLLEKCNLLKRPLQKMATGGFLTAIAFGLAGVLMLIIEKDLAHHPSKNHADFMIINNVDCPVSIKFNENDITLQKQGYQIFYDVPVSDNMITAIAPECNQTLKLKEFSINAKEEKAYAIAIFKVDNDNFTIMQADQVRHRNPKGESSARFIMTENLPFENATLLLEEMTDKDVGNDKYQWARFGKYPFSSYVELFPSSIYKICWSLPNTKTCFDSENKTAEIEVYKGGIFEFIIENNNNSQEISLKELVVVPTDSLHILWQVPQYVLITAGEVLLSITGLAFAYSQAPDGMKSVLQAVWLLTVAIGNLLVIVIEQIKEALEVKKESYSFFTFSILMIIDMLIFAFIAKRYKYKSVD